MLETSLTSKTEENKTLKGARNQMLEPEPDIYDHLLMLDGIQDPELFRIAAGLFNKMYGTSISTKIQ